MGYCVIDSPEFIEVHSDLCDKMFERKEDLELNKKAHFIEFFTFEEVENFINDEKNENKKIIYCEECNPLSKEYDEEGDDFYVEFDDEDECAI